MKVSLREYIQVQLKAIRRAIKVALKAMDRRLAIMNEIRGTLDDQAQTFVRKAEFDRVEEDVKMLREWKSNEAGKRSVSMILSIVSILIALITLVVFIFNSF